MAQHVANGIMLEVETHGAAAAPALVLIRGLGSQLIHWPKTLLDGLVAAGYFVVTFDNRDAGLSQKMTDAPVYGLEDMAADTVGLMDALGLGRAHVLGMSLGGMIAQCLALQHRSRIRSATVVMSSSRAPYLSRPRAEISAALAAEAPSARREDVIAHDLATGRLWQSPGWPFETAARAALIGRAWDRCHCPSGTARQLKALEGAADVLARIEEIATPMLVIHGAQDTLLPRDHGRDIARRVPGARFVEIDGMGHDLEGDLPAILLSHVRPFLETGERADEAHRTSSLEERALRRPGPARARVAARQQADVGSEPDSGTVKRATQTAGAR
jgi:pimeloyl-ACP methyl ester carboxylesterase